MKNCKIIKELTIRQKATDQNIIDYKSALNEQLKCIKLPDCLLYCYDNLCCCHSDEIDYIHDCIIDACVIAASHSIPHSKPTTQCRKNVIPNWNSTIGPLREIALFWHNEFCKRGRPQSGFYYEMRKYSRKLYHTKRSDQCKLKYVSKMTNIAKSFTEGRMSNFWASMAKMRGNKVTTSRQIDGFTEESDILRIFTNKYEHIYNSVGYSCSAVETLLYDINVDITNRCLGAINEDNHLHYINKDSITSAVCDMKAGKSDGYDGLSSDYIINGTDLLNLYITCLFNCIIRHGHCPRSFCVSTLVPIPKNRLKSLSDSNNYRAIALSSILCKLWDACIIVKLDTVFKSNDLLFAYKPNHSTVQCVSTIREIISYYQSKQTSVYMCMLDASKAFDRVNLCLLFNKLRKKGMCPLILRFIINLYTTQTIQIKWQQGKSEACSISNGVKQGGVMSPLLFNLYVQDLIDSLEHKGMGCHMGNLFTGCFIYADDIVLLAPSSQSMNYMLKYCESYAIEHDILFNPDKTKCMYFGSSNCEPGKLTFMKDTLEFVSDCTFLGIKVVDDFSADIDLAVNKFRTKFMSLYLDFRHLQCDVLSKMVSTYCLDVYGSPLWDYEIGNVDRFYVAWRKIMRKVWQVSNVTHCVLLPIIADCMPIDIMLERRLLKFIWSCYNSENVIVKTITCFAMNNRKSVLGRNFRYLAFKYKINCSYWYKDWSCINKLVMKYVISNCSDDVHVTGGTIRELCCSRGCNEFILKQSELEELIELLCTH